MIKKRKTKKKRKRKKKRKIRKTKMIKRSINMIKTKKKKKKRKKRKTKKIKKDKKDKKEEKVHKKDHKKKDKINKKHKDKEELDIDNEEETNNGHSKETKKRNKGRDSSPPKKRTKRLRSESGRKTKTPELEDEDPLNESEKDSELNDSELYDKEDEKEQEETTPSKNKLVKEDSNSTPALEDPSAPKSLIEVMLAKQEPINQSSSWDSTNNDEWNTTNTDEWGTTNTNEWGTEETTSQDPNKGPEYSDDLERRETVPATEFQFAKQRIVSKFSASQKAKGGITEIRDDSLYKDEKLMSRFVQEAKNAAVHAAESKPRKIRPEREPPKQETISMDLSSVTSQPYGMPDMEFSGETSRPKQTTNNISNNNPVVPVITRPLPLLPIDKKKEEKKTEEKSGKNYVTFNFNRSKAIATWFGRLGRTPRQI